LTLLGQTEEEVARAQRELVRIGIDRPVGAATGSPDRWAGGQPLSSYPVASFADLEAVRRLHPIVVLDVRRNLEWAESHLEGAVHISLHELPARLADVPSGEILGALPERIPGSRRRFPPRCRRPHRHRWSTTSTTAPAVPGSA
jgi:hypothetical protein